MAGNNSTSATWAWCLMNWLVLPKADGYVPKEAPRLVLDEF